MTSAGQDEPEPDTSPEPEASSKRAATEPEANSESAESAQSREDAEPEPGSGSAADTGAEVPAEEPISEEPAAEESVPTESAADEPAADEPAAEEPAFEDAGPVPGGTAAQSLAEPEPDLAARGSAAQAGLMAASELLGALTSLAELGSRVDDIAAAAAELARLRSRDTDLISRLHDDVTRLRAGEIAAALNPVVAGMIKLHDQMVSLGALRDPKSPVGMLHTQLLQVLELTCAVRPFTPEAGERFDATRHTGVRRVPATDAAADGTVARAIKAGFARADGSVVRVAEVEVHRGPGRPADRQP